MIYGPEYLIAFVPCVLTSSGPLYESQPTAKISFSDIKEYIPLKPTISLTICFYNIFLLLFFKCLCGVTCMFLHVPFVCLVPKKSEEGVKRPELELKMVLNHAMGTRTKSESSARAGSAFTIEPSFHPQN